MSPDFLYGILTGVGLSGMGWTIRHEVLLYRQRQRKRSARRGGFIDQGRHRVGR